MADISILGISGSLRRESHNSGLLRAAARALPADVEFEEWPGLELVPPFNEDLDGDAAPAAVEDLRAALDRADALLIATPEYNHSIPGVVENALAWVSRPMAQNPMRGKWALGIGASPGRFGAVWAQAESRQVLGALGARVLDEELPVAKAPDGVDDPLILARLAELLAMLVDNERQLRAA